MKTIHEVEEATAATATRETWHEKTREELDAETASLKDQLRTAHAAVNRTHAQMEIQKKRTKQLVAAWKVRLEEGEEKIRRQKQMLDTHMQKLISDLLFFEGALRKEQSEIKLTLEEKESVIKSQKRTIDSLMAANIALTKALKKLKRKYKQKESARADQGVTSGTPSSSVIQQEADALISQIFSNRHKNYTDPFSAEISEDVFETENVNTEQRIESLKRKNSAPHVFFCLTESKSENSTSLKLKTNSASYPLSPFVKKDNGNPEINTSLSDFTNDEKDYVYFGDEKNSKYQADDRVNNDTKTLSRHPTFDIPPSKSCPNLGLAVIAEEINFVPDRGRAKSESAEYLLDDLDADDVDSDVFSASHNSCSSASVLESSFTSSIGGTEERIYENIPAQTSLQRQTAFDEKSFDKDSGDSRVELPTSQNADEEVAPSSEDKWKQTRSPPRSSSFNLLRRIRRPRDVKKKKATRAASDGENRNQPLERQRKLTI